LQDGDEKSINEWNQPIQASYLLLSFSPTAVSSWLQLRFCRQGTTLPITRCWMIEAIRGLLRNAEPIMLKVDPTEAIASIKLPKSKGHHSWIDDEIEQDLACWPLGTQQRLVM